MLNCEGEHWPKEWRLFRLAATEASCALALCISLLRADHGIVHHPANRKLASAQVS
ncbi:unnamed protein product [Effrenium voratum]|nr:unnamed protein product [Effrenium voratum]